MRLKFREKYFRKLDSRTYLIAILLFALFLRIIFLSGINSSDDLNYMTISHEILEGKFESGSLHTLRILMIYPTVFFFWLLGISNFSAALWPLICSMGTIILIYKIGKLLFNERVGLLSAFLLSFFPLDVIYATRLAADVPVAFLMTVSVYLFLKARTVNRGYLYLFSSGIVLGLSYLVKELGLLLFFFYFVYIIYEFISKRKINFNYSFILLGFLLVFTIEGLYYYSSNGDFLLRYHAVSGIFSVPTDYWGKGIYPIDILTFYPPAMLNLVDYYSGTPNTRIYGFFFYFIFLALIYSLIIREKRSYALIIWMLSLFLYLQIGTRSLSEYLLFGKEYRYLIIIIVPALIILASFLLDKSKVIRKFLPISVIFLLSTSVYYGYFISEHLNYGSGECGCVRMSDIHKISDYIKTSNGTFFIDNTIYYYVLIDLNYNETRLRMVNSVKNESRVSGSFIVLNSSYIILNSCSGQGDTLPEFMCNPPKDWRLVEIIAGKNNNTDRDYNPAIYYAP